MGRAKRFITDATVDYRPGRLVDAGVPAFSRTVRPIMDRRYLSVVSYPESTDPHLKGRSFIYDDALALVWFTWIGDERRAGGISNTLLLLQNEDGSFGFSYSTGRDGFYNARYIRTGTVSWAAYALAYYGDKFGDSGALAGASRAIAYLDSVKEGSGLITGGRGRWSADYRLFDPAFLFNVPVTEHQFDAQMAFMQMKKASSAKMLEDQIVSRMWLEDEGRFAAASTKEGPDRGRALDAAGAWGGLWLLMNGRNEMAVRSFNYVLLNFKSSDGILTGYRPYLDPLDGELPQGNEKLIFMEGTLATGLLAFRLGDTIETSEIMATASTLICLTGSGVPYASRNEANFPSTPSVSATLWFLFLDRERSTGNKAPVFSIRKKDPVRPT